jgi:hypothetical protein
VLEQGNETSVALLEEVYPSKSSTLAYTLLYVQVLPLVATARHWGVSTP